MCQAPGHAWCATWEGASQFGRVASGAGRLVALRHRSQLDEKRGTRVRVQVGLKTVAARRPGMRNRNLSQLASKPSRSWKRHPSPLLQNWTHPLCFRCCSRRGLAKISWLRWRPSSLHLHVKNLGRKRGLPLLGKDHDVPATNGQVAETM